MQEPNEAAEVPVGGRRGDCLKPPDPDDQTQECQQKEGPYYTNIYTDFVFESCIIFVCAEYEW